MSNAYAQDEPTNNPGSAPYTLSNGETWFFAVPTIGMYPRFNDESGDGARVVVFKALGYPLSRGQRVGRLTEALETEDKQDICEQFLLLASSLLEIAHCADDQVACRVLAEVDWVHFVPFIAGIVNKCELVPTLAPCHAHQQSLVNRLKLAPDKIDEVANLVNKHMDRKVADVPIMTEELCCSVHGAGTYEPAMSVSVDQATTAPEGLLEEFVEPESRTEVTTAEHVKQSSDPTYVQYTRIATGDKIFPGSMHVSEGSDGRRSDLLSESRLSFRSLNSNSQSIDSPTVNSFREAPRETQNRHTVEKQTVRLSSFDSFKDESDSSVTASYHHSGETLMRPSSSTKPQSHDLFEVAKSGDYSDSRVSVSPAIARPIQIQSLTDPSGTLSATAKFPSPDLSSASAVIRTSNHEALVGSIEDRLERILEILGKASFVPKVHLATARERRQKN